MAPTSAHSRSQMQRGDSRRPTEDKASEAQTNGIMGIVANDAVARQARQAQRCRYRDGDHVLPHPVAGPHGPGYQSGDGASALHCLPLREDGDGPTLGRRLARARRTNWTGQPSPDSGRPTRLGRLTRTPARRSPRQLHRRAWRACGRHLFRRNVTGTVTKISTTMASTVSMST